MATAYTEEQVRLASLYSHVSKIKEAMSDLVSVADFTDASTFDREDGTSTGGAGHGFRFDYSMAYSQALQRPSATACAYLNDMQLRMIRAASRAFCMLNPYWGAVRENIIAYTVGTGHVLSVVPRHKGQKLSNDLRWKVTDELELFCQKNQYRRVQGEKLTRLDRDGEFFLRFFDNRDDGILRVRFVEPILVQTPPGMGSEGGVEFGIGFENEDYTEPVRYFVRPADYQGKTDSAADQRWRRGVDADQMQRRTANVDLGSPRGLPTTYTVQERLNQAVSTLKSMGRLVDIRARIALIRKQVNATLGQIQPLLQRQRVGQAQAGGKMMNVFGIPYGSVFDMNDQRSFEMPSQNIETDKIVHSLKSDLQAVASLMGLADFCISGDASSAFANAMIKEGPMDRAVGKRQTDLIEDDMVVYERALTVAADNGRLPADILKQVRVDVTPPGVIARDRLTNTQADQILWQCGAISSDSMARRSNLDPDDEKEKGAEPRVNNGDLNPSQPSKGGANSRGIPAGKEPGPAANKNTAKESLEESSSDDRGQQKPTEEDMRVAANFITPDWLETTKRELLALPQTGKPLYDGPHAEYEPGIPGVFLGTVDGQEVWAVDFDCMVVKYDAPDICVGANSYRWTFVPQNRILIDWVNRVTDVLHIALHELIEQRAMGMIGWNYARAHRLANNMPGGEMDFLLQLRPELSALKPKEG